MTKCTNVAFSFLEQFGRVHPFIIQGMYSQHGEYVDLRVFFNSCARLIYYRF